MIVYMSSGTPSSYAILLEMELPQRLQKMTRNSLFQNAPNSCSKPYSTAIPPANIAAAPPASAIAIFVGSGTVPAIPGLELEVVRGSSELEAEGVVVGAALANSC